MVVGRSEKPRYDVEIHVFGLSHLFLQKKFFLKFPIYYLFFDKNFFFFLLNRSIIAPRQKFFFYLEKS